MRMESQLAREGMKDSSSCIWAAFRVTGYRDMREAVMAPGTTQHCKLTRHDDER